MPRKKMKNVSRTKKVTAKQTKTMRQAPVETMEKNFRAMPASIAAQYGKDLSMLKQQENKLKNEHKKAQAQQKIAKNKCAALMAKTQSKPTATAKKQLVTAKKAHDALNKAINSITSQLDQMAKRCKALASNQAKFTMLSKELTKLEKQWELNAKKAVVATKKAPKKIAQKAAKQKTMPNEVIAPHQEQIQDMTPANEPVEADA